MENKAYQHSTPDLTEHRNSAEGVNTSEQSEENDKTNDKEQFSDVKDREEEGREDEKNKVVTESEEEEGNEGKPTVKTHSQVTPVKSSTAVSNFLTYANDDTCPSPPPRQRRKSKTDGLAIEGRKETHEEALEEKESEWDGKKKEDTQITTDGGKAWKEKPDAPLENEKEDNNKGESGEATQTKQEYNTGGGDARNRKTDTPNDTMKEKPPMEKNMKEDGEDRTVGLKKELSLLNCVGLIVGNIIGTGIFVTPRSVLANTGSVGMSLIVWVISGVMAIFGAISYSELGTMIPQSGGNYTYLYEAYGSAVAFLYVWVTVMIGIPGYRAVAALSFANYILQPFFPNEQEPPQAALRIVGILLILMLTYINSRRVRWATRVQDTMALTKVFALVVIILVGLYHLTRGTTENYKDAMAGTSTNPASLVSAFYHTLFAYSGWDSLNEIIEELKDPFRNMPRAIAISLTCVIVIYTLTNVAYFAVLPKELILASPAVAVTFGNLTLGVMAWTVPIFVASSICGGLNGSTFTTSRILFVSARRGHLPRFLSFVHVENNTPITSLYFVAFMSMWMFVTSDVRVLIAYLSFAGSLVSFACISSFFWFRFKYPDLPRPIKVWIGFPIIYLILAFCLCVIPVVKQPLEVVAALIVIATGLPVYYFLVHREQQPQRLVTAMDKITYVCQLLFMAVPEEKTS